MQHMSKSILQLEFSRPFQGLFTFWNNCWKYKLTGSAKQKLVLIVWVHG